VNAPDERRPNPWVQLWLSREREFLREPGVLFWVFGFPVLLAVALGLAFRGRGPEKAAVVVEGVPASARPAAREEAERARAALAASDLLDVRAEEPAAARARLERGEALVLVTPGSEPGLSFDPSRPGARAAAALVRDALERAAGRKDLAPVRETAVAAPGRRYIDVLLPGLLGMSLMSGGIWGVGWALVNLRIKRLLKRLVATPMRREALLASFLAHRLIVATVETAFLLAFGRIAFDVEVRGSYVTVWLVALVGAASFSGLGLLVGCRAKNAETANGLMNLATLPMWILSGVFFSAANFPDAMRPFVDALPLTALNDALRAVIGEGASLASLGMPLAVLAAWGLGTFGLAMKAFRWR
jgi:ABC-type multidrug transport system permease subunit